MRIPVFPEQLPEDALADPRDSMPIIDFTPVPRLRRRRNGWSEAAQRGFIAALSRCGSVSAAARVVGMTPRSAYRLADADGADSFVAAWDQALDGGMAHLRGDSLERALMGGYVPVYRRGKLVQVEHRRNDRLAIALLGGRPRDTDQLRRTATSRRAYRLDLFQLDGMRARRRDAIVVAEAEYQHDGALARLAAAIAAAQAIFRDEVDRLSDKVAVSVGFPSKYPAPDADAAAAAAPAAAAAAKDDPKT